MKLPSAFFILRYFNVAGASPSGKIGITNKKNNSLFNILAKQALKKKPVINIFGNISVNLGISNGCQRKEQHGKYGWCVNHFKNKIINIL